MFSHYLFLVYLLNYVKDNIYKDKKIKYIWSMNYGLFALIAELS